MVVHPDLYFERSIDCHRRKRGQSMLLVLVLAVLGSVGCEPHQHSSTPPSNEVPTAAAQPRINATEVRSTPREELKSLLIVGGDEAADSAERLGDEYLKNGRIDDAIESYRAVMEIRPESPRGFYDKLLQAYVRSGQPYEAVQLLKQAIAEHPSATQFYYDIAGISSAIGMAEESLFALRVLIKHGQGDFQTIAVAMDPGRVKPDWNYIYDLVRAHPQRQELQYGLAAIDFADRKYHEAATKLSQLLAVRPDIDPAWVLYGQAIVEAEDGTAIQDWAQRLPVHLRETEDYWAIAGDWSLRTGNHEEASRAYLETLRINPGHFHAMRGLYQSLSELGLSSQADLVAERIEMETAVRDALGRFFEGEHQSQTFCFEIADQLIELGRPWEAYGWARKANEVTHDPVANLDQRLAHVTRSIAAGTPWQMPGSSLAEQFDPSELGAFHWHFDLEGVQPDSFPPNRVPKLDDRALALTYHHEALPRSSDEEMWLWIYQTVGGGVGVIDFDLDGWPDLASSVLDGTPMKSDNLPNTLHRNIDGKFRQCNVEAGYVDHGFGQGILVCDYNEDGFPDLFDCNIGENRLYQNQGDGTFLDVTHAVGLEGKRWSASAAMADLDGDGLNEIFEVCYCGGDEPFRHQCGGDSHLVTCPPLQFPAEPDVLWSVQPDGRLVDKSQLLADVSTVGRGLGIVAGQLDGSGGLDCYIANDMSANHLWSYRHEQDGFQETGTTRGLGLSGASLAQASMGVAVADADGDGDLDFYVTHFSRDYNTYYEQISPGNWADRTYQAGMLEPTMPWLGFGTQFLDLTNSGRPDLFIANGHVNRPAGGDKDYEMPPQLFQRAETGRWGESAASDIGGYFEGRHLGRSVAITDLNRDGRLDLAVTHASTPSALLVNQTEKVANEGAYVRIYLRGTVSSRDAVGATVSGTVQGALRSYPLLSGNGYMGSNESVIHVGLGPADTFQDVKITWPSGRVDQVGDLSKSQEYLCVESSEQNAPIVFKLTR
ncbi:FG-GAP-like repeat-containing protein [Allorhodopirellula solitaria]|uniref:ASPIC and UnbV n=1 Tax=Allorhodopirellula solitaria TaxID=2527987 RepID=A0A5C5XT08_9BACT|nr:FG-GAP-like repeat-containing protein [Allorhodopirellula solitaria]TWT64842.1 ASPIC and UnbV [Allorhodopirellula solitaria]